MNTHIHQHLSKARCFLYALKHPGYSYAHFEEAISKWRVISAENRCGGRKGM